MAAACINLHALHPSSCCINGADDHQWLLPASMPLITNSASSENSISFEGMHYSTPRKGLSAGCALEWGQRIGDKGMGTKVGKVGYCHHRHKPAHMLSLCWYYGQRLLRVAGSLHGLCDADTLLDCYISLLQARHHTAVYGSTTLLRVSLQCALLYRPRSLSLQVCVPL